MPANGRSALPASAAPSLRAQSVSTLAGLWERARRLAVRAATDREARVVLFFTVLAIVGGFFGNRLLTQVARPEALGTYYLYANLAQWLSMPAAAAYVYVIHHWPIAREHGDGSRFARAIGIGALLQIPLAVVGTLLFFAFHLVDSGGVALGVGLLCIGTGVFQLYSSIPYAERRRTWAGVLGLMGGAGRPFIQALGVVALGAAAGAGLLGSAAALQLAAAGVAVYMFRSIVRGAATSAAPQQTSELTLRAFLSYSVPGFFGVFVGQLASSVERWGLARSSDVAATALFVQAIGLSTAAASALGALFQNYFYPFATNAAARDLSDPLGAAAPVLLRFYALLSCALGCFALLIALFVRQITALAFGSQFAAVSALLPWTTVGACLFSLGQALTIALFIARAPLWPNLSRITSQTLYAAALILLPKGPDPAGRFARLFACAQLLYVAVIVVAIWRSATARRRGATTTAR